MTETNTTREAPERIWFAPDEAEVNAHGWAGVASGKDRLFFEGEDNHHPDDDGVLYIRADIAERQLAEAQAEIDRLREAERWQVKSRAQHYLRRHLNAPEDHDVYLLCERYGYGAVMDAASRLWARKDGGGAFYIGGCIGFRSEEEARAALIGEAGE